MKIAYFVNQYPKVSHSFIRREILALEGLGLEVKRFALRGWDDPSLVDPDDIAERARTRFVLQGSVIGLVAEGVRFGLYNPARMWKGLRMAFGLAKGGDRTVAHHLVSLLEGIRLSSWLRAEGVSHVHAHFGTNSTEVVMLSYSVGGPSFSFTAHGSHEWDMPLQFKIRDKVALATFVVGVSAFTCAQLMRWSRPQDWGKVHQIHCGLGSDFLEYAAPEVNSANRFVCVGRLCKEKAQILLVDAVAQLRDKGVEVELVLAGDGEDRGLVQRRIDQFGLGDRITITGWIAAAQVREHLLSCRALVVASFMEALPVVIMEALALRRPVVTTAVAGIPELVREGESGWLVEPGSASRIASAMEECVRTPIDLLRRMGDSGFHRVLARHCSADQARRLAQLFRQRVGDEPTTTSLKAP
jgi:glycosyltransferase involved in cell wall biosynthesis